ncbi:MAG: hypothetical protein WCJ72_02515 [Chryseobacterium sp.]
MAEITITPIKAVEIMRELSRQCIPFSIKYLSYNETEKRSEGFKTEIDISLEKGYRRNQSKKHGILVSYSRLRTGERRQFYYPLVIQLNDIKVRP